MTKELNWHDRIEEIKFFAQKHNELDKFKSSIISSIFVDLTDPEWNEFLNEINKITLYLESRFLKDQ